MQAAAAIRLKSRINRIGWGLNAINGVFLALLGAVMAWRALGNTAQLAPLMMHTGATFAVAGVALLLFSLWRARMIFAKR